MPDDLPPPGIDTARLAAFAAWVLFGRDSLKDCTLPEFECAMREAMRWLEKEAHHA